MGHCAIVKWFAFNACVLCVPNVRWWRLWWVFYLWPPVAAVQNTSTTQLNAIIITLLMADANYSCNKWTNWEWRHSQRVSYVAGLESIRSSSYICGIPRNKTHINIGGTCVVSFTLSFCCRYQAKWSIKFKLDQYRRLCDVLFITSESVLFRCIMWIRVK